MTIWERVKTTLTSLSVPMAASHYLVASGEALPDVFLVYFLVSNPPVQHADNAEVMQMYRMQVSCFSRTGLTSLPDVKSAMVAAGFIRAGAVELPFDQESGHYGLALDFVYQE